MTTPDGNRAFLSPKTAIATSLLSLPNSLRLQLSLLLLVSYNLVLLAQEPNCNCGPNGLTLQAGGGTNITSFGLSIGHGAINNTCMTISGILIINTSVTINGGEIIMMPDARIDVNPGVTFGLSNVNVNEGLHGCQRMWQGIRLLGTAAVDFSNSHIKDARVALECFGKNPIRLVGNNFDRNYISLFTPTGSGRPLANNGVSNNFFQCQGNLLPGAPNGATRSRAGFELNNAIFFIGPETNTFQLLQNGILLNRSVFAMLGGRIVDMVAVSDISNENEVWPNVMPDGVGIFSDNHSVLNVFDVFIDNVRRGIFSIVTQHNTSGNQITRCVYGIVCLSPLGDAVISENDPIDFQLRGIQVSSMYISCNNCIIRGNLLNGIAQNSDFPNTQGTAIWVDDIYDECSSVPDISHNDINIPLKFNGIQVQQVFQNVIMERNTVIFTGLPSLPGTDPIGISLTNTDLFRVLRNDVNTGFAMENANARAMSFRNAGRALVCNNFTSYTRDGLFFDMNCEGSVVQLNQMTNYANGLYYGAAALVGEQDNKGNQWLFQSFNAGGARRDFTGNFLVTQNRYKIGECQESPWWPPVIVPTETGCDIDGDRWFWDWDDTQPSNCNIPFPSVQSVTSGERAAANGDLGNVSNGVLERELQKSLFAKLNAAPSLANSDAALATFYQNAQSGNLRKFHDVGLAIQGVFTPGGNFQSQFDFLAQRIQAISAQIQSTSGNTQEKLLLLDSLAVYHEQLAGLVATRLEAMTAQAQGANAANATIAPVGLLDANEKTVNNVFLQTVAKGVFTLDPAQSAAVYAIANQCPLEGGSVVYKARTLYHLVSPEVFEDAMLCGTSDRAENGASVSVQRAFALKVSPNPANEAAELSWPIVPPFETANVALRLTDLSGKIVRELGVAGNENKTRLAVTDLVPGLYLISLLDKGQVLSTSKIVIVH